MEVHPVVRLQDRGYRTGCCGCQIGKGFLIVLLLIILAIVGAS